MEKQLKKTTSATPKKSTRRRKPKPVVHTRIWPSEDHPRFGQRFKVIGVQFIDIDRKYTEMLEMGLGELTESPFDHEMHFIPKLFEIGKTWGEWKRNKEKISDQIVDGLNENKRRSYAELKKNHPFPSMLEDEPINFREVCAFKIEYIGGDIAIV